VSSDDDTIAALAATIEPASTADAELARAQHTEPQLAAVAGALAAAQHGSPRARDRTLLVVAADQRRPPIIGASPTTTAATAIHDGSAAVARLARNGRAAIVIADLGCSRPLPPPAVALPNTPSAGAALVISLAETTGLDILLLGALGTTKATRLPFLTGAILAAASLRVAVILDGDATAEAARAAIALQPNTSGYVLASQRGTSTILPHVLPIFDVHLGHGDGSAATLLLPLIDRLLHPA
jgi:NaMN:DMB phosphoribosyltransferase